MEKINPKNIKALNFINSIQQIIRGCIAIDVIGYFFYSRVYKDNTRIMLSSEESWFTAFNTKYYSLGLASEPFSSYQPGYILWPAPGKKRIHQIMQQDYGITNQLTFILKNDAFCELYTFATSSHVAPIHNIYINNLDSIYEASLFIKSKISSIVDKIDSDRLVLPTPTGQIKSEIPAISTNKPVSEYLKNAYYQAALLNYHLTQRELECLLFIIGGKSDKYIASVLNISARTVEAHWNNIKLKLKCKTRTEATYKILKSKPIE